jgi:hypothetical protein
VEVVTTGNTVRLSVSGAPGTRQVTLSGAWRDLPGWTRVNSTTYQLTYAGGRTVSAETTRQ